jgi:hypothetical protein
LSDLHELQLRLAELYRLRDEYAARSGRSAMARYVDMLIARLEAEIAPVDYGVAAGPVPEITLKP